MTTFTRFVLITAALLCCATVASATETPTGPFTGTYTETFESFPNFYQPVAHYLPEGTSIMGGFATITSANQDMGIYNTSDASFGFYTTYAGVSDGSQGLGLNSVGDSATITFSSAVTSFGGYFGADWGPGSGSTGVITFSFPGGGTSSFVYSDPNVDDTYSPLIWQGWNFSTGINSVTISSDFLAMDGLQASASVPDGGTTSVMLLMATAALLGFGARLKTKTGI
jgi:hypothetical protein